MVVARSNCSRIVVVTTALVRSHFRVFVVAVVFQHRFEAVPLAAAGVRWRRLIMGGNDRRRDQRPGPALHFLDGLRQRAVERLGQKQCQNAGHDRHRREHYARNPRRKFTLHSATCTGCLKIITTNASKCEFI